MLQKNKTLISIELDKNPKMSLDLNRNSNMGKIDTLLKIQECLDSNKRDYDD